MNASFSLSAAQLGHFFFQACWASLRVQARGSCSSSSATICRSSVFSMHLFHVGPGHRSPAMRPQDLARLDQVGAFLAKDLFDALQEVRWR